MLKQYIHGQDRLATGQDIEEMAEKVADNYMKRGNWITTDILVIDEVSMMSKKMFELLELTGRLCRKRNISLPFGGIQIIFSGDFYQLPPVGDIDDEESCLFCFESELFDTIFENKIEFTKSFRQKDDEIYSKTLNQIRIGKLTKSTVERLKSRVGAVVPNDIDIEPTRIYPTRLKVDQINNNALKCLSGDEKIYNMKDIIVPFYELTKEQQKIRIPASLNYEREFTLKK